jgi:hypothetical protein
VNDIEVMVLGRTVATLPRQTEHARFSPNRYPFTYAYDLLREHRSLVPDSVRAQAVEGDNSRANMAYVCRVWAREIGDAQLELVIGLADAFLEYHEVIVSGEELIAAALKTRRAADRAVKVDEARRQG